MDERFNHIDAEFSDLRAGVHAKLDVILTKLNAT